jgi:hypothetical protein
MSTRVPTPKRLQINEDVAFQLRMDRIQRVCRWFFLALLVAAILGLAGGGLFSETVARDTDGKLLLRFDRFARSMATQTLELEVRDEQPDGSFDLHIDNGFVRRVQIESILPQPREQRGSSEQMLLNIGVNPESELAMVVIRYRPLAAGWLRGRLGAGRSVVAFEQLVYP